MHILALETSGTHGSVAALDDLRLRHETMLPEQHRVTESFAPALVELLDRVGWRSGDVELVAVTRGPGSFTGLRIGAAAAKTFAYAAGCELLGVDTLEVLAAQTPETMRPAGTIVHTVLDAQRRQFFAASWRADSQGELQPIQPSRIVDRQAWLEELLSADGPVLVSGLGLKRITDSLPEGVQIAPPEDWQPRASATGRLALRDYQNGRRCDLWTFLPNYFRSSSAEEKAG